MRLDVCGDPSGTPPGCAAAEDHVVGAIDEPDTGHGIHHSSRPRDVRRPRQVVERLDHEQFGHVRRRIVPREFNRPSADAHICPDRDIQPVVVQRVGESLDDDDAWQQARCECATAYERDTENG